MKIIEKPKTAIQIIQMVCLVLPFSFGFIWILNFVYFFFTPRKYLGMKVTNKYERMMTIIIGIYMLVIILPCQIFIYYSIASDIVKIIYLIIISLPLSLWLLWYQRKNIIDPMLEEKERRKQEK